MQFGILSIARILRNELRIIDGQHRTLGFYMAAQDIADELAKVRASIVAAERAGDQHVAAQFEPKRRILEEQRRRMDSERISAQIHIVDDAMVYEQMFDDVAENQVGITGAIKARFDNRKIVNRVLDDVLKHKLLKDYTDLEQDRITATSPYWLGAKHVADITRTLQVGIRGRIGRRTEDELSEADIVAETHAFLEGLADAFPDLNALAEGTLTAQQLRSRSLLGSVTMIRALAGAWYELKNDFDEDQLVEFFGRLAKIMGSPLPANSPWLQGDRADAFYQSANGQFTSPNAHRGVDVKLTGAIVHWARVRSTELGEAA